MKRSPGSSLALVAAIGIAALLGACMQTLQAGSAAIPDSAWKIPVDVENANNPSQEDWLNLGWDSFIALNWPAQLAGGAGAAPIGGQPNENMNITNPSAAAGPTVWMTYLDVDQVFRPLGVDPGSWAAPNFPEPTKVDPAGRPLQIIGGLAKDHSGKGKPGEFDEADSNAPLFDQNRNYVLFEIRMNQSEFSFLQANGYYDSANQVAAFVNRDGTLKNPEDFDFQPFPKTGSSMQNDWAQQGAVEIKAAWRILVDGKDDESRYYTQRAYFETPDDKVMGPYTLGLVGLHILRLTPTTGSTWFWASFEQVDNVQTSSTGIKPSFNDTAGGGSAPTYLPTGFSGTQPPAVVGAAPLPQPPTTVANIGRLTPIPADVATVNAARQATLAGTPWQYYELVNTLNPVPAPKPPAKPVSTTPLTNNPENTAAMVNTTMESYTQSSSTKHVAPMNCNDCHGFGFPLGFPLEAWTSPGPPTPPQQKAIANNQVFTFLLGRAETAKSGKR